MNRKLQKIISLCIILIFVFCDFSIDILYLKNFPVPYHIPLVNLQGSFSVPVVKLQLGSTAYADILCITPSEGGQIPVFDQNIGFCTLPPLNEHGKCAIPYMYSRDYKKCISNPMCTGGQYWNASTKQCLNPLPPGNIGNGQEPPLGPTSPSSDHYCVVDKNGDGQISEDELQQCIATSMGYICSIGQTPCDPKFTDPTCPQGTTYNGTTKKCEANPDFVCPQGTVFNSATNLCEAGAICPEGSTINSQTGRCEAPVTVSCPNGMTYNSVTQKCEVGANCPNGTLNTNTDRCELNPSPQCPPGTTYNTTTKKCNAAPQCPPQTSLNPTTDKCEGVRPQGTCSSIQVPHTKYQCPVTGTIYEDLFTCNANCVQVASCNCVDPFNDVPCTDWAAGWIQTLKNRGMVLGCNPPYYTMFCPNLDATRAEIAAIVIRYLYGENFSYSTTPYYTDVSSLHWAFKYIQKAYEVGIMTGYGDGTFRPDVYTTRAQAATVVVRARRASTSNCSTKPYADVDTTYWGCPYIQTLKNLGLGSVLPDTGSYFYPEKNVTRRVVAYFLARAFELQQTFIQQCPFGSNYPCSGNPPTCSRGTSCVTHTSYTTKWQCSINGSLYDTQNQCLQNCYGNCPIGTTYDSTQNKCIGNPGCPVGAYDPNTNLCETNPTFVCPQGMTFNSSTLMCEAVPQCPSGTTYNTTTNVCEANPTNVCPQGTTYDPATGKCFAQLTCPLGTQLNTTRQICESPPNITCPAGTSFNSQTRKCETSANCPDGQQPQQQGCPNGYSCPLGNYQCMPVGDQWMCSPHSCGQIQDEGDLIPSGYENDGPKDQEGNCLGTIYIFNGKKMRCRKAGIQTGFHNCCNESKGKMYDSTGSTGFTSIPDMIKTIAAVYQAIKVGYWASKIAAGEYTIQGYYLMKGSEIIAHFSPNDPAFKALQEIGIGMNPDVAVGTAIKSYIENLGPNLAWAIAQLAISRIIKDPVLSSAVNLVGTIALMALGKIPVNYFMIALQVINLVMALFMQRCDHIDIMTSTLNDSEYCHEVGEYCAKRFILLGCVQEAKGFCCFNTKLARIIHEQGRPQLAGFGPDGGWGQPKNPNCRGFLPEEFQALDFNKIDLSEYMEDIERNMNQNIGSQMQEQFNKSMNDLMGK